MERANTYDCPTSESTRSESALLSYAFVRLLNQTWYSCSSSHWQLSTRPQLPGACCLLPPSTSSLDTIIRLDDTFNSPPPLTQLLGKSPPRGMEMSGFGRPTARQLSAAKGGHAAERGAAVHSRLRPQLDLQHRLEILLCLSSQHAATPKRNRSTPLHFLQSSRPPPLVISE